MDMQQVLEMLADMKGNQERQMLIEKLTKIDTNSKAN
jgi:hypothetical protein